MTDTSVFRFPISGRENGYFLLEASSNGRETLDLKLVGSESTAVFMMKLRHKRVRDYKAENGPCSHKEWEEILTSTFVNQHQPSDIEIRADVEADGSSVTLSFRKNIQGITQRLGSVKLGEDEKTEISPFDWCVSALGSRERVEENLAAANVRVQTLEASLSELRGQIDDLIKTKEEDETQLLEKFRDLLNEKKVKIRQQQRLLASANVDPEKLANISGGSQSTKKHVPKPSRASKRKVKEEPESSEDGFEQMDIDEDGDNGSVQHDNEEDRGDTTADETASGTESNDESEAPPPQRNLPIMRRAPEPAEDDETESDDEL